MSTIDPRKASPVVKPVDVPGYGVAHLRHPSFVEAWSLDAEPDRRRRVLKLVAMCWVDECGVKPFFKCDDENDLALIEALPSPIILAISSAASDMIRGHDDAVEREKKD